VPLRAFCGLGERFVDAAMTIDDHPGPRSRIGVVGLSNQRESGNEEHRHRTDHAKIRLVVVLLSPVSDFNEAVPIREADWGKAWHDEYEAVAPHFADISDLATTSPASYNNETTRESNF
jgi:hypothetical protein